MLADNLCQLAVAGLVLTTHLLQQRAIRKKKIEDQASAAAIAKKVETARTDIKADVCENTAITIDTHKLVNGRYTAMADQLAVLQQTVVEQKQQIEKLQGAAPGAK